MLTTAIKRDPKLLAKQHIEVKYENGGEVCGWVKTKLPVTEHSIYTVSIFKDFSLDVFRKSPYFDKMSFATFLLCVLYHEVAHVIGQRFVHIEPFQNFIFDYIMNCLDDDRDEYLMAVNFPDNAKYLQLLQSCTGWKIPPLSQEVNSEAALRNDLNTVFFLCRFGVIKSGADPVFVSHIVPRIISSRRGNRKNSIDAGLFIYNYLLRKHHQEPEDAQNWQELMQYMTPGQEPLSQETTDEALKSPVAIPGNANLDALKEMLDGEPFEDGGQLAGLGGDPPSEDVRNDDFYNETVKQFPDVIHDLRNAFLLRRKQLFRVVASEGDFHPRLLDQAFEDSMTGEERKNRVGLKKTELSIDVAWAYDVSGSRSFFEVHDAHSKVCTIAALDGIEGIRQMLVDWNTVHRVVMEFGDEVCKARIYPNSGGGTEMRSTITELLSKSWKSKEKYAFFITDGYIDDWTMCVPLLWQLYCTGVKITIIQIVTDDTTEMPAFARETIPPWIVTFASTLQNLPRRMINILAA